MHVPPLNFPFTLSRLFVTLHIFSCQPAVIHRRCTHCNQSPSAVVQHGSEHSPSMSILPSGAAAYARTRKRGAVSRKAKSKKPIPVTRKTASRKSTSQRPGETSDEESQGETENALLRLPLEKGSLKSVGPVATRPVGSDVVECSLDFGKTDAAVCINRRQ